MAAIPPYRLFNVTLLRKRWLSPSLVSCLFTGEELEMIKRDGPDQRIKILFPSPQGFPASLNRHTPWREQLKTLTPEQRPVPRTYTLRAVNAAECQAEVEFVVHGTAGPASAWVIRAAPGDALQMVAPNRQHVDDSGGYEWHLNPEVARALVVADETALPAVKGILEQVAHMASPPALQIFQEVPRAEDSLDWRQYAFAQVFWLPRDRTRTAHGAALLQAVKANLSLPDYALSAAPASFEVEQARLWHGAARRPNRFYGWVAAESSAVRHIRRYLVNERQLVSESVSFMAYWSKG
ncbi:siderophore-interacting protein [Pantoea sp. ACRSH]|uniref:siderophore-interacting protein n=1 Tax=unclassified Pantoea TaxID=2630326 RepID=UPI001EF6664F|nr:MULTISPECIES: siderophore-interacting protein [unclassified Pantoea]MCG7367503.1 siderophore-interacting protein [Pantoea sp. ACRSH]MCG7398013.1 siderophore-interacting protein [Pantoea sp. ACRSC]